MEAVVRGHLLGNRRFAICWATGDVPKERSHEMDEHTWCDLDCRRVVDGGGDPWRIDAGVSREACQSGNAHDEIPDSRKPLAEGRRQNRSALRDRQLRV